MDLIEKLFFRSTIDYFEHSETIFLLKYKDEDLEVWLAAVPFPVNSPNPKECIVSDEIFVRYGDDEDFTQEVLELIELREKDGKLEIIPKEEI